MTDDEIRAMVDLWAAEARSKGAEESVLWRVLTEKGPVRAPSSDRKRAIVRVVNAIEDTAKHAAAFDRDCADALARYAVRDELIEALTALLETT